MDPHQLVRIFCQIDDFCKELNNYYEHKLLTGPSSTPRGPSCSLEVSEMMTILVMFQYSGYRTFKNFYTGFLAEYWHTYFPQLPSYARFITIMNRAMFPMILFTQMHSGRRTGIYYIDSSCLPVSHIKRSRRHKTFRAIAEYGRTSVGWFFGLKLHIVINHNGELVAFKITSGKRHDAADAASILKSLHGLVFGDKGYIGKKLFEELFAKGLKLITRQRKNMKSVSKTKYETQLLNQRGIIETVIGHLKNRFQVWHTRHRSQINAMTHLLAALVAYTIEPLKISALKKLCQSNLIS